MPPLRLLASSTLPGDWQMAIDDWLLEQRAPAFRLYHWSQPTLSLGFHQRRLEPHWLSLAAAGRIALVRRPSGGRAVLHAGTITYALVWPAADPARQRAYARACGWLLQAFAQLGLPLQPGRQAASLQRSSCFATSTAADLVHRCGAKRIGSAQLWRRGCLLQHGSILVNPPAELWQELFGSPPAPLPELPLQGEGLEALLRQAALQHLPMLDGGVAEQPLEPQEWAAIAARRPRYGLAAAEGSAMTAPLASPEASMERTTWGNANPSG